MIEFKTGDLLAEDADALVNTVNCDGFMGRGIALQFKKAWPDNFKAYAAACRRGEVQPGRMFVFATGRIAPPRFIVNFPTKLHWRNKSRIEDIESGLVALGAEIRARGITSIAIPPLGAGLGGLPWSAVRERIARAMSELSDVRVIVFEPSPVRERELLVTQVRENGPASTAPSPGAGPRMTPGRAALLGLMGRYLDGLLDPFVSLLEVHKLMYFMQEAGEPLRLRIKKAPYGPYAENLRHVLSELEGQFIRGYGDGGDAPEKYLELLPGALETAREQLARLPETRQHFDRVGALVEGFESPFGLELLATVHWLATREGATSEDDVIAKTYEWNERKKRFTRNQIGIARRALIERGWLPTSPT